MSNREAVITVFTSPGCAPCAAIKALAEDMGAKVTLVDVTTEEGTRKAAQHRVRSVPTTVVQVDGDVLVYNVGFSETTKEILRTWG